MIAAPPRLAAWLLQFCGGYRFESVVGDLTEEYQRRQSPLWYWWQVGALVMRTLMRNLGTEGLSIGKAVAAGWLVLWLLLAVCIGMQELWMKLPMFYGHSRLWEHLEALRFALKWLPWIIAVLLAHAVAGRVSRQ
jgi:hypothetical protein